MPHIVLTDKHHQVISRMAHTWRQGVAMGKREQCLSECLGFFIKSCDDVYDELRQCWHDIEDRDDTIAMLRAVRNLSLADFFL